VFEFSSEIVSIKHSLVNDIKIEHVNAVNVHTPNTHTHTHTCARATHTWTKTDRQKIHHIVFSHANCLQWKVSQMHTLIHQKNFRSS